MLLNMCSSHEQLPEEFTGTAYKAGMCVHHTKNYQSSLLMLGAIWLFLAPLCGYPPALILPPCRSASGIGYASKNYLK